MLVLLLLSLHSFSQNTATDYSKEAVDAALKRQKHNYEMDMYQRYTGYKYKPYVGVNAAFMRFYGDVMPRHNAVTDLGTMWGLSLAVPTSESESWLLCFSTLFGTLHSYQTNFSSAVDNLNFLSRITQLNVSLTYQHKELWKIFHPYASVGIGMLRFNPTGDLKDASGKYYPHHVASEAIDYDQHQETDLRRRDLYGDGSYARTTPVIPLELGLKFPIGNFFNVRIAYLFTYTFTDFLDNVSGKTARQAQKTIPYETARDALNADYLNYYNNNVTSPQMRAAALRANTGNDMYGGLHVSLHMRLFTSTKKIYNYTVYKNSALRDGDAELYKKVMLDDSSAPKSRFTPAKEEDNLRKKRIPRKLKSVDSNGDGIISSVEINDAVEQYIDGKSPLTRKDIIALQQFYRSQLK